MQTISQSWSLRIGNFARAVFWLILVGMLIMTLFGTRGSDSARTELLNRPAWAVVGSRNATAQGNSNAEQFAHSLSDAGLTIVSGLAQGIDAAAHRGAADPS